MVYDMGVSLTELHDLVATNETQQGTTDRITGEEIRTVDNAIIDAFQKRGNIIWTGDWDEEGWTIPSDEGNTLQVWGLGIDGGVFVLIDASLAGSGGPGDIRPSTDPTKVWYRVARNINGGEIIAYYFMGANGITYDYDYGTVKGTFSIGRDVGTVNAMADLQTDREIGFNGHSLTLQGPTHFTRFGDGFFQIHGRIIQLDNTIENQFNAKIALGAAGSFPSALFEMTSTSQGFLWPRMTQTQRDAIVSPVAGLQIYNTTTNKKSCYNGVTWLDTLDEGDGGSFVNGKYKFEALTAAAKPANGRLRLNNATYSAVTQIYINKISDAVTDITGLLKALNTGDTMLIQNKTDSTIFVRFGLSGVPVDNTDWWTIPVTFVKSNGAIFAGGSDLLVAMMFKGI